MSHFSETLVYLRKRENMSQQELADKLGVVKSSISMYENGARKPSFETLEAIAEFFNVSLSTLVGDKQNQTSLTEDEARLIEWWRTLPEEKKKAILTLSEYS